MQKCILFAPVWKIAQLSCFPILRISDSALLLRRVGKGSNLASPLIFNFFFCRFLKKSVRISNLCRASHATLTIVLNGTQEYGQRWESYQHKVQLPPLLSLSVKIQFVARRIWKHFPYSLSKLKNPFPFTLQFSRHARVNATLAQMLPFYTWKYFHGIYTPAFLTPFFAH